MKFIVLIFWCLCGTVHGSSPLVEIEHGWISGTYYTLRNNQEVVVFFGIPYAAPPILEKRFEAPKALEPWIGIWNASIKSSNCLQFQYTKSIIDGEEDCLYLNVYTPRLPKDDTQLMDVLVYIHAGAFLFGSGASYSPDYIMKNHDIVYVSFNYRLGVLGFFSSGDTVVPGNNGLKDQVTALKWVQRNIIKFGGNPNSVTIFGTSSGAASVHYHYLSPLSEGIFHKGISLSGSVLPAWTLPRNNTERSLHLAFLVGCPVDSKKEMIECLRRRPGRQLVETSRSFYGWRFSPFTVFGPVIEPLHAGAFISEEPIKLLADGNLKHLPWLTFLSKDEGLFSSVLIITNKTLLLKLDENWDEIAPDLLMYSYSVSSPSERYKISSAIRKFYFGEKRISADTIKETVKMLGDRKYVNDVTRATKMHAAVSKARVFCSKFSYRGKYSVSDKYVKNRKNLGVAHGDVTNYIVSYLEYPSDETEADIAMGNLISSIFANFMKTGTPKIEHVQWEPVSKNEKHSLQCLDIQSVGVQNMIKYSNDDVIKFWQSLFPFEYSKESFDARKFEL